MTLAGRSSPDVVQTQAGPNFEYTLDPMLNSYPEGNMAITVDFRDRAGNVATTVRSLRVAVGRLAVGRCLFVLD